MPTKMNFRQTNPSAQMMIAAMVLAALALPASAHRIEKHFIVEGKPVVTIHNSNGRIQVNSWKKSEVMVIGDHGSSSVEVESEQAGSRIEINTRVLSNSARGSDLQADYQITVPEETQLTVRTDIGSIVVESVHGDLRFETLAANVSLQDTGGVIFVRTADGSIVCARCDGRLDAESVSGNVQLLQPIMDQITVHTTAGNILFDGDFLRHGVYVLKSDTGNTNVHFGAASSFDLTANSVHGSVINEANLQPDKHGKKVYVPKGGNSLLGTVGTGNAKVELYSFSGTIKILRRDQ